MFFYKILKFVVFDSLGLVHTIKLNKLPFNNVVNVAS